MLTPVNATTNTPPTREQITESTPQLVGTETCRNIVFPDQASAPAKRTWQSWILKGYFPVYRIGRRVFLDPTQVRLALDRRFKISAA